MSCAIKWGVHSLLVELRLLQYAPGTSEEYHFARFSAPITQACNSADEYACYQPKWQQENDYLEDGPTNACVTAIKHGWFPCTLAAFTTALGLISLYASNLIPIQKPKKRDKR